MLRNMLVLPLVAGLLMPIAAQGQVDQWTHRGRTSARNNLTIDSTAPGLTSPRFVAAAPAGYQMVGQSAPVVHDGRIFVYAIRTVDSVTTSHILAFRESDGGLLWIAPLAARQSDSWSAPTICAERGLLLMPSNKTVTAIVAQSGQMLWETTLDNTVVNGTIMVHNKRAYVADHKPMSAGAKLYCLNLDPDDNDHDDGAIIWSQPLMRSVGSEAALATTSNGDFIVATDMAGYIRQFTPNGATGWTFALPGAGYDLPNGGFNGGLAVDRQKAFAATYNFYGQGLLVCVDVTDGQQVWSTLCERTNAVPVIGPMDIYLSGGVTGYGSQPKVEAFDRISGQKRWQWTTAGSWTMQPLLVGQTLYVGDGSSINPTAPANNFYALDISKTPADAGFVKGHFVGCGSSPAYANGNIYSIGANGLHAFGPPVGTSDGPQVIQWASLAQHGAAGTMALTMADGFVEPRLAGLRILRLTFDQALEAATVTPGAISIADIDAPAPGTVDTSAATVSLDAEGTTLTLTLPAPLLDGRRYCLSVDPQLQSTGGMAVEGALTITVGALAGDVNGDRKVNSSDVLAVRAAMGAAASADTARLDVGGSGTVAGHDMRVTRGRTGGQLAD